MTLDPPVRQLLDQYIDQVIENPSFVKIFRDEYVKEKFGIRNPEDYAVGMAVGGIIGSFQVSFSTRMKKQLTPEELSEVGNVIFGKISELRNAIIGVSN